MAEPATAAARDDPASATTVPALVRAAARRYAAREAVVDGAERWSFAELGERVEAAARGIAAAGVAPGDRVAIWAPNAANWIPAALGALAAGAALVPLNTRYRGHEAGYILRRSRASLLLTVDGFLGVDYRGLLRDAGVVAPRTILLDEVPRLDGPPIDVEVAPDDLSDVIFTSGTTGEPKGVLTTHAQTTRVFATWSALVGLREGDRYLVVNPFFHTFGYKAGIVAAVMRGAAILPHAVFDADSVLRRVAEERVTVLPGPPALYASLLAHPSLADHDVSSLRLAVTGAASIPVSLVERVERDLGVDTVLTAYGLTEATGVVTVCREGDDPETVATTSGGPIPDVEVRTVADDGTPTPPGTPGEVVVRGYNVMRGYLDEPERTRETVVDGWLHTGDVGVLDERGYLTITDRKKDVFIVGGFNAYPAEIEQVLLDHDDVAQVAVVGAPDERLGEVGVAFVVARGGVAPDADGIIAWARERLANFKVPRRVEFVEALPTNASGKVLKGDLRERART